jgi:hypothetical protein
MVWTIAMGSFERLGFGMGSLLSFTLPLPMIFLSLAIKQSATLQHFICFIQGPIFPLLPICQDWQPLTISSSPLILNYFQLQLASVKMSLDFPLDLQYALPMALLSALIKALPLLLITMMVVDGWKV